MRVSRILKFFAMENFALEVQLEVVGYELNVINKTTNGVDDSKDVRHNVDFNINQLILKLGTAWFRSDDVQAGLITIEIPVNYGELDASFPTYMQPVNGLYVAEEQVPFILSTHITFVASSSFDGANFAGAVGSTLVVDDIELNYE